MAVFCFFFNRHTVKPVGEKMKIYKSLEIGSLGGEALVAVAYLDDDGKSVTKIMSETEFMDRITRTIRKTKE